MLAARNFENKSAKQHPILWGNYKLEACSSAHALTLKRSGSGSGFGGRLAALISSHDFSFRVRVRIWAASRMDPKVMVWENGIVFEYIIQYLNGIPIGKFPYRQIPSRQIPYRQNPLQAKFQYRQIPNRGKSYRQNPYRQNPYRQNPYGQNPYGHNTYRQHSNR